MATVYRTPQKLADDLRAELARLRVWRDLGDTEAETKSNDKINDLLQWVRTPRETP